MNRRSFLAVASAVPFAGCGSGSSATEQTPTQTETPTETATQTPTETTTQTPSPGKPIVEYVNLLSDWKEYGDVIRKQTDSITPSETALIGARFQVGCSADRKVRWRFSIDVEDSGGEVVATASDDKDDFTNNCDPDTRAVGWEQSTPLYYDNDYSAEWPTGEYTATVEIEDYYGGETVSGSNTFEVVEDS